MQHGKNAGHSAKEPETDIIISVRQQAVYRRKKEFRKLTVKGKFKGWFYFSQKGNMVLNKWVSGRYYKADGSMASGLTKIGSRYYFFQRSTQKAYRGKVYKSKWIKFNKKYYCASKTESSM